MIAEAGARQSPPASAGLPEAIDGETIHTNANWTDVTPRLSILVPTYKDSANQLLSMLAACHYAESVEIIVYDDGSQDIALTNAVRESVDAFPGAACLITAEHNKGRSAGRNRLQASSRAPWLVFLDADMIPDDEGFIVRYLKCVQDDPAPRLVVGGFSMKLTPFSSKTDLHRAQSERSECIPAHIRSEEPGRYVFTSNVLAHRDIMNAVPFDPAFSGWGWEDVEWGIRVSRQYPVEHIDNTATHLGLDTAQDLLRKYEQSGANFWLAVERHPDVMEQTPLYRMASMFSRLPGRSLIREISRYVSRMPVWLMPRAIRLLALKTFRAAVYGGARHAGT
ncbi:glycosyltransferase family A protein [Ponticaulis sp.]|uniref:glycosyltransferase family 2 protein n=1 Tax=Ponticaulis sp. TaxID=2020902 RepID=UPI0025E0EB81|nr:glycosyltransferase family A protein [Ponticaulis sp.]